MTTELKAIDLEAMRVITSGYDGIPVEQTIQWERFETAMKRSLWGCFEWYDDGVRCAVIALYRYTLGGQFDYLWAKWGPVWLKEATPEREKLFRKDLRNYIRSHDRRILFVRLHAWFQAPDLRDVLQSITYDRTVVIESCGGDEDAILETMTKSGKRTVRRARKNADAHGFLISEDTGLSAQQFEEHYRVLVETAERDGFRPHDASVYTTMLETLGPECARLFSLRDASGQLLCWDLVLVHADRAQVEYGASTDAGRKLAAPVFLDFMMTAQLGRERVTGVDLMGAHSARTPELFHVGKYKRALASQYTDVPGGWDMPIRPKKYALVQQLLKFKRHLSGVSS